MKIGEQIILYDSSLTTPLEVMRLSRASATTGGTQITLISEGEWHEQQHRKRTVGGPF